MTNKKLFIKNAFSGIFQKIIIAILTFFTIPIFISKLGTESYGIFATVSVIGDLSRIANIGFHIALIKYLSAQGKTKESSIDIIVGLTSMIAIIVPISVLMIIFNHFVLVHILNISPSYLAQSRGLYIYLVLANMLLFTGLTFSAMLESLRLIYISNVLQLVYSIAYWSLILVALFLGKGIEAIGLMAFLAALIWFLLVVYKALMAWGKLSIKGIRFLYWRSVKKQLSYGLQIYASGLMAIGGEPVMKVLVANFFGHTYVGFLDIGMRIRNQVVRIFQAALWPLFQLFSEIKDNDSKARIVKDIQEKTLLVLLPICFLILFGARSLVSVWIGKDIDIISWSIIYVTIGSLIGTQTFQAMNNYLGVDHPLILLVNSTIINVIYLATIVAFRHVLGYDSVFLSFTIACIASMVLQTYFESRFLGSMIFSTRNQIRNLFILVGLVSVCGWGLSLLITSHLALLIVLSVVIPVVCVLLYILLSLLTENDLDRYVGKKNFLKPLYSLFRLNKVINGVWVKK